MRTLHSQMLVKFRSIYSSNNF